MLESSKLFNILITVILIKVGCRFLGRVAAIIRICRNAVSSGLPFNCSMLIFTVATKKVSAFVCRARGTWDVWIYIFAYVLAPAIASTLPASVVGAVVQGLPSQRQHAICRAKGGPGAHRHGSHCRPCFQCGGLGRAARRLAAQWPQQHFGRAVRCAVTVSFRLSMRDNLAPAHRSVV
jgi:hypothetical protein